MPMKNNKHLLLRDVQLAVITQLGHVTSVIGNERDKHLAEISKG